MVGKLGQSGSYLLKFQLPQEIIINVTVLEAKLWESEGQLIDEKRREIVTHSLNAHELIGLNEPKVAKKEDGYSVEVDLNLPTDIPLESVRAHIISSAFVYNANQVAAIRKTLPASQ